MNWSKLNSSSGLIVASAVVAVLVAVNVVARVRKHAVAKTVPKVRAAIVLIVVAAATVVVSQVDVISPRQ